MAVPSAEQFRQTYISELQPHLHEAILAVGFISTPGYARGLVSNALVGKAVSASSFLAGRMFNRARKEARDTVVQNQLVAVTASSVYLFDFLANGRPFAVSAPPTVWLRSQIRVTAEERGRLSQKLHVAFSSGELVDVDVNFGAGDWATFNDGMLALLTQ